MRVRTTAMMIGLVLLASACASEQAESEQTASDAGSSDTTVAMAEPAAEDEAGSDETAPSEDDATPSEAAAPSASGDGSSATVTLENGESYTFDIICGLEPQIVGSVQILFTAVSYDDPVGLDVTQFGDETADADEIIGGMLAGAASITLFDSSSYDTLWESNTIYDSTLELEINGNTITGHGDFLERGEFDSPSVPGELVANC